MYSLSPSKWHQVQNKAGMTQVDTDFTILLDYMPSGDYTFLLLGQPGSIPGSVSNYKVRTLNIITGVLQDKEESLSAYPLSFHGAHDQGLLIWQHRVDLKVGFLTERKRISYQHLL